MLLSCGSFLSFHFLYFLYSKSTVGINGIHQPLPSICDHPELSALLTLAPMHVLATQVQKNDLKNDDSLSWFCFLFNAVYWRCAHLLHAITVICWLSAHCNACFSFALQSIQKRKRTYFCGPTLVGCTACETRKKAPFAVLNGKSSDFDADHLHLLLS